MRQNADPSKNSAIISACGRYRYRLDRPFYTPGPTIAFLLHNPSTADADRDDPTSRRGIAFAKSWGAGRMVFVNAFAGRATQPIDLWKMSDPVGPENMQHIVNLAVEVAASRGFFVFAWGNVNPSANLRSKVIKHLQEIEDCVRAYCPDIFCLGTTKYGQPRHPLYRAYDTELVPWSSFAGVT